MTQRTETEYIERGSGYRQHGHAAMERARPRPACETEGSHSGRQRGPMGEAPPDYGGGADPRVTGAVGLPNAGSFVATPFDEGGVPMYYHGQNHHLHHNH